MEVQVTATGPLFTRAIDRAITRGNEDAVAAVTEHGVMLVGQRLGHVLQHPTGFYESRIDSTLQPTRGEVHDSMVIYGPWLEGVGSRNATTRFKGYFTFRRVTQQLDAQSGDIAEQVIGHALRGVS